MFRRPRKLNDWNSVAGFLIVIIAGCVNLFLDDFELVALVLAVLGWMLLFVGLWPCIKARGYKPVWILGLVLLALPLYFVVTALAPERREAR